MHSPEQQPTDQLLPLGPLGGFWYHVSMQNTLLLDVAAGSRHLFLKANGGPAHAKAISWHTPWQAPSLLAAYRNSVWLPHTLCCNTTLTSNPPGGGLG